MLRVKVRKPTGIGNTSNHVPPAEKAAPSSSSLISSTQMETNTSATATTAIKHQNLHYIWQNTLQNLTFPHQHFRRSLAVASPRPESARQNI